MCVSNKLRQSVGMTTCITHYAMKLTTIKLVTKKKKDKNINTDDMAI